MKSRTLGFLAMAAVLLVAGAAPPVLGQTVQKAPPPPKGSPPAKDTVIKKNPPVFTGKADLCFSSVDGVGTYATVDPDGDGCLMQQEYKFGIKNVGVKEAPSFVVQFTFSNSVTKQKEVVNRRITVLKPGQVVVVTFKFSFVADSYSIKLDAKGEVEEVKESNNENVISCIGGAWKVCK